MVVWQVSGCALWCYRCLRVIPVWFCCAFGICLRLCSALCAFSAFYPPRFWPPSGGQHPVFRFPRALVRVEHDPPDSPGRQADGQGNPEAEKDPEGMMTDGEIAEY